MFRFKYNLVDCISSIILRPFAHFYMTFTSVLFLPIHFIDLMLDTEFFTELLRFYITKSLIWLLRIFGRRVFYKGTMDISSPCIIAVKHEHSLDTVFMVSLKSTKYVNIVAKKELSFIPFLRTAILVDRSGRDIEFFNHVKNEILVRKKSIIIFPEGTRVRPDERKPYSGSIALIARRFKVRVLPVSTNVGKVLNRKKRGFILLNKYGHVITYQEQETLTYEQVIFNHYYDCVQDTNLDKIDSMNTSDLLEMIKYILAANHKNHTIWHNSNGSNYFKLLENKLISFINIIGKTDLLLSSLTELITFDLPSRYHAEIKSKFIDEINYCAQVFKVIKGQHPKVTDQIFTEKLTNVIEYGCEKLRKLV